MATITARQAATHYGVSLSTIYRRIKRGLITAIKNARRWAITIQEKKVSQYWIEEARDGWYIVWTRDHKKIGRYISEASAQRQIDHLEAAPAQEETPAETGWSNAAKRRAAHKEADVDNALGRGISSGKGYTMYEGADDSGRYNTQIWDES